MGAEEDLRESLLFYKELLGQAEGLAEIAQSFLPILEKLLQFAGGSVKRCKDKNLDEAHQLLLGVSKGFWELEPEHLLPLVRSVLACQAETTSSSGSFHRLEKMVVILSERSSSLVSQLVEELMSSLTEDKEVLSPRDLQTVCMFVEESALGRRYWRNNLTSLLRCIAATFNLMLREQDIWSEEWQYITVKICLQLFKLMPQEISPLVWHESEERKVLQSILGSLLQVIIGKAACKETRLLAGTALSMLVNTAPDSQSGATAVLGLSRLLSPPECAVVKMEDTGADGPKGECQLGMLRVPLCAGSPDGLERLVLTRGLLACCKKSILSCQLGGPLKQGCLLLDVLFPATSALMDEQKSCQYYCFQVFSLWLQRLRESLDAIWKIKENRVLADNSSLLRRLTQVLWNSAESLVLGLYEDLPQHLLNCLSTNHLCPVASDVYKTLLQLQRKAWTAGREEAPEDELAEKWAVAWLPTLSQALTSPVPFLQSNASNYLLGWTLRIFPAAYPLLAQSFRGRDAAELRAWVTLLSAQKTIAGVLPTDGETLGRLSSCLFSQEENIRLGALSLLCSSPRTNQALSPTEIRLLKEFLLLNLNCDSSAFRQLLQASVKKALVRLRDSSLASLHRQMPNKGFLAGGDSQMPLAEAVDFVEWLLQLCASSLTAGSNYQRRKSALLLLAAILETCTDTWSPKRKKGQPPCNMAALLGWARSKGCWDFFSQSHMSLLVSCLQDGTNEICELASELLVCYFPPTFPESIAVALFARAQEAVSSPRVQEGEAGAVLMKTILQKSDDGILQRILAKDVPAASCRYLCFLKYLLGTLRDHSARAHRDLLQAARSTPMHGVISALRRCLLEVPEVATSMLKTQQAQQWRQFLSCLVSSARDISTLLLGVLQSKRASQSNQQAAAPSFAEMGNAIGCLIRLGKGLEDQDREDAVLLSVEHSLILTCCWVSVKGAVEGCSVGFTKFCTALLSHPDPDLRDIPRAMLAQGLELLSSPRSSSVTRRAAGFPMLFLCIVPGEGPAKSHPLLADCIQTLLALASTPIRQDWDQTLDLPQVSAVHVLQTLVRGSGLGAALHPYITSMVTLSLEGLGSPNWAMRNAAIQLLSALTVRLLGQKQSRDNGHSRDRVSPEALFSRYPQLKSILLGELTLAAQASGDPQRGKFHLCPSLYAILSFLAKLQPSTDSLDSIPLSFAEPLFQLSGNPIYAVRVMAAKALVPLIPAAEHGKVLLRLVSDLPRSHEVLAHNALHGGLLQIQSLLAQALNVNSLPPNTLLSIAHLMEDRIWLLTPTQRCPLVRLAYLQAASLLVGSCPPSFAQHISEVLRHELDGSNPVEKPGLAPLQNGAWHTLFLVLFQLGFTQFRQFSVHFLCTEAARLPSSKSVTELCSLLQRGTADEQTAVLTWIMENEGSKDLNFSTELQQTLLEKLNRVLKGRNDSELVKLHLEAFVHFYSYPPSRNLPVSHKLMGPASAECMEILLSMVESNDLSPVCFRHALCGVALLLPPSCEDHLSWERWCAAVERCSRPLASEERRMAAAASLKRAGASLVCRARASPDLSLQTAAVRSIDVAIGLLQDGDPEVRQEASVFASLVAEQRNGSGALPQSSCHWLQSNKGLLCLLQLLLETFGDCPETFACLVRRLPAMDLGSALTELEADGVVGLYKEDEPNVYAEPAVLAQTLFPFLLQLLSRAPASPKLWGQLQSWLEATGPGVWSSLRHGIDWWRQEDGSHLLLKALACPKVHTAIIAVLVKAFLVAHALNVLEEGSQPYLPEFHFSSQDLKCAVRSFQDLLAQHGVAFGVHTAAVHEPTWNAAPCLATSLLPTTEKERDNKKNTSLFF
ncbi:hypothetical protein lerEdw1_003664 [Lerista edwardsae]|nr:hypothetical protein lerEdw1_003664 [Lerista edwardsae]